MTDPSDLDELAAVVADGAPFDWASTGSRGAVADLQALWRVVQAQTRDHILRVRAPRARLHWAVWLVAVAASTKALVALVGLATLNGPVRNLPVLGALLAVFVVSGLALLYAGVRDARARHFGVLLLLIGNAFSNPLILELSRGLSGFRLSAVLSVRALCIEAFIPALLWLFGRDFPAAPISPRRAHLFRRAMAVCVCVGLLLVGANLALFATSATGSPDWARLLDRNSSGTSYYWLIVFVLAAPALVMIRSQVRRAAQKERDRVRIFVSGLVAGFVPSLLVLVLANRSSPFQPFMVQHFWLVGALVYGGLLVVLVVTSYAVVVDRVVRVEMVLRNGLQYGLARTTLFLAATAPIIAFAVHLYRNRNQTIGEVLSDRTSATLAGVVVVLLVLGRTRRRVLAAVDRRLFRESRPLDLVLSRFGERGRQTAGLGDLALSVTEALDAGLHPERSFVLVADTVNSRLVPVGRAVRPLSTRTWLVEALERTREPVTVDLEEPTGLGRLLPRAEQDWLADSGATVLVPLCAAGGALVGLIGVGPKLNTLPFTPADLGFLAALAAAAAPSFEARLLRGATTTTRDGALPAINWSDEPGSECRTCGVVLPSTTEESCACGGQAALMPVPRMLHGKFALERRIGAGGMGVVYRAADLALGRAVAVKTLPRIVPESAQRLREEAKAMAAVSHPNLAVIYGAETWRAVPILIVEFLDGGTLGDKLRRGPLSEAEATELGRTLAAALGRLHAAGILHRDVKPSNVGFTRDGTPKLLDFGLARLVDDRETREPFEGIPEGVVASSTRAILTSQVAGTPLYLSPEAVRGKTPDVSFDLWALATVLLEALAGRHPWADLQLGSLLHRIAAEGAPDLHQAGLQCSDDMRDFLYSALSKDLARRPQTAAGFERALALAVSG